LTPGLRGTVMEEAPHEDVAALWLAAMRRGDWAEAWRQTDRVELPRRTRQTQPGFLRGAHHLRWDGTPFDGRSVLVRCEHGLGDTLQFIRFVPQLARLAREVTMLVQPHLLALLQGAPGLGTVLDGWTHEPAPAHDVEIEIMELAYALRSTVDTVPAPYPHLAERVAGKLDYDWPADARPRVGLLWAASDWDRSRSIPVAMLEPLLRVRNAHFFSLQQGNAANDAVPEGVSVAPLSRHTGDIVKAASAMMELDLVICVDGMAAHLAGTLGRPTWLLLKHEADWRWMQHRDDSPWYPAMRLLRQPRPGDWGSLVARAAQALSLLAPHTRHARKLSLRA
jgi:hypothetical protein